MHEGRLIAVFCQGSPLHPEEESGFCKLADFIRQVAAKNFGNDPTEVYLFGPHIPYHPVPRSEAAAVDRCIQYTGGLPRARIHQMTKSRRLSTHVQNLKNLVLEHQPRELIIVCEESALAQVYVHLHHHFADHPMRVEPVAFNPRARRWSNRFLFQPLRTLIDWGSYKQPWLFSPLSRAARHLNLRFNKWLDWTTP